LSLKIHEVDFSKRVPKHVADEIIRAADKYGVIVFRKTSSTEAHIEFSKYFGDLDDNSGYMRLDTAMARRTRFLKLFDVSIMIPVSSKMTRSDFNN